MDPESASTKEYGLVEYRIIGCGYEATGVGDPGVQ